MSIREFQLVEPLGSGGYGTIWMAKRRRTEDLVAIKVLSRQDTKAKKMLASVHPPPPALCPSALGPTLYTLRRPPYAAHPTPYALRLAPAACMLCAVSLGAPLSLHISPSFSLYLYNISLARCTSSATFSPTPTRRTSSSSSSPSRR